ncbi:MAG: gamma-glutamyltransferase [Pseudomonadota bacterium]
MIETALGLGVAATTPHRLATKAAADVLEDGGTAIEAMVCAAAVIAVVYPHMNGIGGDGFWLIKRTGEPPVGVFACGQAAATATPGWYAGRGHRAALPSRGGAAALTVPGTLGGWQTALDLQQHHRPLAELLAPAIAHANHGIAVSRNQSETTAEKLAGLRNVPGFAQTYLVQGDAPGPGTPMTQAALGKTLARLGDCGVSDFYRGELAHVHASFLEENGSPLRAVDFAEYAARRVTPLSLNVRQGRLFNMVPPTQGVCSLGILGVFDRLGVEVAESFEHWHGLIEATKQVFILRNAELGDARTMPRPAQDLISSRLLDELSSAIDPQHALPWPHDPSQGDTIWMGTADTDGTVVSFIQSVFWEFGSGLTCTETGVFFQNRGAGFSLAPGPNQLRPGHFPFHTLNPALAELSDGRVFAYGTMGGEGQPQTQSAIYSRYAMFGQSLQHALTSPRWLLGKTWGDETTSLKIEANADPVLVQALKAAGHEVETVPAFSSVVGHGGAVVQHVDGRTEAASDPRSDGWAYAR